MVTTCTHVGDVDTDTRPASADGCEDCLRVGGTWVHLRMCRNCGHIGCCDSSPNKHATAHHAGTSHPLISTYEPGEDWRWCYDDTIGFIEPDQPTYSHR
jgi:uncharacterized UBP type Zn finger protein